MSAGNKKFGLGRGLEALLGEDVIDWEEVENNEKVSIDKIVENTVFKQAGDEIDINKIQPCRFQPREVFDEDALQALSESIREKGILQPLLLRQKDNGNYEIIAGERRWRAAQRAGLKSVPAIIKNLSDEETLEIALIENLQRENLTPIEEAEGLNRLMQDYDYTQEVVSKVIGRSRSYITNALRLLALPADVRQAVNEGKLSAGHARALVGIDDASELAREIIAKGLSVREAEKLAAASKRRSPRIKTPKILDVDLEQIMRDLETRLKLKVKISAGKKGKGSVTLHYNNPAELSTILDILEQR
ncbi:MAG: ParB/RepB/Spo0J family partition protein [Alphaproteobacteria bacterium]|nr:ParB/RepB/Spo0J family partition protein [Alphaproteobacteria bacterium]